MLTNLWLFLREVRWLAVLAVVCVLAGLIVAVYGATTLALVLGASALTFATLARIEP